MSSECLATFQVELTVIDHPTERQRWNGGPMASEDTDAALYEAVEAFRKTIERHGFYVVRMGYGVTAREVTA